MNGNDRYSQLAQDINAETGWELFPSEIRENEELQAHINVDTWLRTGNTNQLEW